MARLIRLVAFLVCLLCSSGALAQDRAAAPANPAGLDIAITIFSQQGAADLVSVVYGKEIPEEEVRRDFTELAGRLGIAPPRPTITRKEGFMDGSAEMAGLTDWSRGTLQLDPLIQTYRRYGYFRVMCLFFNGTPQPVASVNRPPLRVEAQVQGSTASFQVWVDQSGGVPSSLPSTSVATGSGWRLWFGIIIMLLVLLAGGLMVGYVLASQRKRARMEEGEAVDGTADR